MRLLVAMLYDCVREVHHESCLARGIGTRIRDEDHDGDRRLSGRPQDTNIVRRNAKVIQAAARSRLVAELPASAQPSLQAVWTGRLISISGTSSPST